MDFFLDRITSQAINYAVRSGITLTAGYALQHASKLVKNVEAPDDRHELQRLQERLQSKIRIISPAIDMIELISARGNTTLESAVDLTGRLRQEIQSLAQKLQKAATEEAVARQGKDNGRKAALQLYVRSIIRDIKSLIEHIEDAVPFLNLAITASGARIASSMPSSVSPSRLLQASTFLTTADSSYAIRPRLTQVGPTFTLSLYMLFAGHIRPQFEEDVRTSTWKEVIHKARLKLMRVPLASLGHLNPLDDDNSVPFDMRASKAADEYAYQLHVIEDLEDDRVHSFDDDELQPGPFEDVAQAGIREVIPVHEISKIFYADTGKILNIGSDGDIHRPVLLLKRDLDAIPPRRMSPNPTSLDPHTESLDTTDRQEGPIQSTLDSQFTFREPPVPNAQLGVDAAGPDPRRIPPDLDPEWLAFEVYSEHPNTDDDDDDDGVSEDNDSPETSNPSTGRNSISSKMSSAIGRLDLEQDSALTILTSDAPIQQASKAPSPFPQIRTSLSLLETLLRLASLQQFQQMSHLSIEDEFLNFFLSEAATTGAAIGDEASRRRLREEARRRVGFDPFDESPTKRRGEDYQDRGGTSQAGRVEDSTSEHASADRNLVSVMSPSSPPNVITPKKLGSSTAHSPPSGFRRTPTTRIIPDGHSNPPA